MKYRSACGWDICKIRRTIGGYIFDCFGETATAIQGVVFCYPPGRSSGYDGVWRCSVRGSGQESR